jgi:hypothetical protein
MGFSVHTGQDSWNDFKASMQAITPSSRVYQNHRPEAVLHPSIPGSGERRENRLMLPQSV